MVSILRSDLFFGSSTFPSSNSSGTGGSGKKDNQNKEDKLKSLVKEMEEEIFSTTIDYEKQFQ
jgi:hypothetical protein